jgi:hypothetical protein
MVILPLCFWTGDVRLGAEFTLCLLIGTFLGNFAKNMFALPRPPAPPVKLLQHTMKDFGFPSVHTLNAVTVSGVLVRYHYQHAWFYFSSDPLLARLWFAGSVALALLWCVSIPLSRMYVGVHSPLDVVGGFLSGLVFLALWVPVYPAMYLWTTETRTFLIPVVCVTAFLAVAVHPRSQRPSPSYRNNIAVIGIVAGAFIGLSRRNETAALLGALGVHWPQLPVEAVAAAFGVGRQLATSVLRFLLGISVMVVVKAVMEPLLALVFTVLFILPFLSVVKSWVIGLLGRLTIPHPDALNNVDHPYDNFAREILELQEELELEMRNNRRLARREAGVLSRVVTQALLGIAILDVLPALFELCGLKY